MSIHYYWDTYLNMRKNMKKVKAVLVAGALAVSAALVSVQPASAAVVLGNNGLWYGNICQTTYGWQVVPWQLVGATCYAPGWGSYGYIANY